MSEESQRSPVGGIDYTRFMGDKTVPGTVPLADVPKPQRVDFGIDTLGQWRIEVRTEDGTLLDWADDGLGEEPADLSAYPVDSPVGAVDLQAELKRRFPDSAIVWRPGVMNSLDEHRAAAHRALATAAADRAKANEAADDAEVSLRKALHLARLAGIGPTEIAERTGYARSTITKALRNMPRLPAVAAADGRVPAQPDGAGG
ncbi:hypothetical protein ACFW6V_21025 [Streptomyces sp. NPDC058734]|uniref:hypothetical protein n=1 Tax=unclassified Streptomyces TaxID=2593676 RepID=UPI00117FEB2F|nr:hypothetical protein [Streptomyces sp. WZ.A104]